MSRDFASPNDLRRDDTVPWSPSGAFAVAAWVYRDTNAVQMAAVAKWKSTTDRSFVLYVDTGHVVQLATLHANNSGGSASKSGFTDGAWHHIGFELDGITSAGRLRVYLDGVAGTDANPPDFQVKDSTIAIRIGSSADDGTTRYWDGAICDVAAWSTWLSAAEWGAMARGVSAGMIRPQSRISLVPNWGLGSSEGDLSGNVANFDVNVSLPVRDHGPVGCPFPLAA